MSDPLFDFTVRYDTDIVSINKLYSRAGAKVFLTTEGEAFKGKLTSAVVRATQALPWPAAIRAVYREKATVRLVVTIYTPKFWNQSWKPGGITKPGKKALAAAARAGVAPKGNPQSPYQKIDATNFAKIIEDGIAAGTGIDDSLHHDTRYLLREGAQYGVKIRYRVMAYEGNKDNPG